MLSYFSDLVLFLYSIIKSAWYERKSGRRFILKTTILQVYFTGFEALPIITITALGLGAVLITQSTTILDQFGMGDYVDKMIVQILIRELSPLVLALVVVGRSGTAMSTELGNMKLNREIQALDVLGINLHYFIVLPRLLGTVIAMICLVIYFNILAVFGGYFLLNINSLSSFSLWGAQILSSISVEDISVSLLKAAIFGLIISVVTCSHGLSVKEAFTEVPQVATKGVVNSIIFCFLINVVMSLFLFPVGG